MNFTAIDFETATPSRNSACSLALVRVENKKIVDEYQTLIRPPGNYYYHPFTNIHGLSSVDTGSSLLFPEIFIKIIPRLKNQLLVAHNASFDSKVLKQTAELYGMKKELGDLSLKWDCSLRQARDYGLSPANLAACAEHFDISLNHHQALSDARACAKIYLLILERKT